MCDHLAKYHHINSILIVIVTISRVVHKLDYWLWIRFSLGALYLMPYAKPSCSFSLLMEKHAFTFYSMIVLSPDIFRKLSLVCHIVWRRRQGLKGFCDKQFSCNYSKCYYRMNRKLLQPQTTLKRFIVQLRSVKHAITIVRLAERGRGWCWTYELESEK